MYTEEGVDVAPWSDMMLIMLGRSYIVRSWFGYSVNGTSIRLS